MSQIAHAYVVPFASANQLVQALAQSPKNFWQTLSLVGKPVEPAYQYSGQVLAVLLAKWEEHDIQLPLSVQQPPLGELLRGDLGLVVCADANDAKELLEPLKTKINETELRDFFNEFTAQDFDEAGVAMQSGQQYIIKGLEGITEKDDYYLLFIS